MSERDPKCPACGSPKVQIVRVVFDTEAFPQRGAGQTQGSGGSVTRVCRICGEHFDAKIPNNSTA
jgi:hypothetical protein